RAPLDNRLVVSAEAAADARPYVRPSAVRRPNGGSAMDSRKGTAALLTLGLLLPASLAQGDPVPPRPPGFWKSRLADADAAVKQPEKGSVRVLTQSAGKRAVYLATYGARPDLKSRANYNSACGGVDPASFARKDGTQPPVVFLLGPVHGGEL